MNRPILALARPTKNVVHGFMCWGGAFAGTSQAHGDLFTSRRSAGVNQPFLRPDMGVADALNA